ncbi:MAG: ATP-binding protein [Rhizomicrobium sp.]
MEKAFVSWSSGKDGAFALYEARRFGLADIAGVLVVINEKYDRVAMHGVRHDFLNRQIEALNLPAIKVLIPSPCPNETYEARMAEACAALRARGVFNIVFGDLFLEDIRTYREDKLSSVGMRGLFPLWRRDTGSLAREMIDAGLIAHLVCVDPKQLDKSFAGRRFDHSLLARLPHCVDPCGENGEYHTVVSAGPMFSRPIEVSVGAVVERDGFVFADVSAADETASAWRL